uniref:Uncharacterized protein n=1 Tax=Arundo donax TaxID=35708 RepID=A0A0A8YQ08_ARUDO
MDERVVARSGSSQLGARGRDDLLQDPVDPLERPPHLGVRPVHRGHPRQPR